MDHTVVSDQETVRSTDQPGRSDAAKAAPETSDSTANHQCGPQAGNLVAIQDILMDLVTWIYSTRIAWASEP